MTIRYIRLGVAVAAAGVLGYLSWANAMGNILARSQPELALQIDSSNEFAYDKRGSQLMIVAGGDEASQAMAMPYVQNALERVPWLAVSLRNFAFLAEGGQIEGDPVAIMKLASEFSKRDRLNLLWLIENSSRSGDVDDTLKYYDRALTAEPGLQKLLFPLLAGGLTDPDLQSSIVRLIASQPSWGDNFVGFMANDNQAVDNLPLLEARLGRQADLITREHRIRAASRLIAKKEFEKAEQMLPGTFRCPAI